MIDEWQLRVDHVSKAEVNYSLNFGPRDVRPSYCALYMTNTLCETASSVIVRFARELPLRV
eukprot:COSAG04_NODE_10171_length_799_cov_0.950000_2_plen_60_part_01